MGNHTVAPCTGTPHRCHIERLQGRVLPSGGNSVEHTNQEGKGSRTHIVHPKYYTESIKRRRMSSCRLVPQENIARHLLTLASPTLDASQSNQRHDPTYGCS